MGETSERVKQLMEALGPWAIGDASDAEGARILREALDAARAEWAAESRAELERINELRRQHREECDYFMVAADKAERKRDAARAECERLRAEVERLREACQLGQDLSRWAAAIRWDGKGNTPIWLQGLRDLIERTQDACRAALAPPPAADGRNVYACGCSGSDDRCPIHADYPAAAKEHTDA